MYNTNYGSEIENPFMSINNGVTLFKSNVGDVESNNVCHSNYFECWH
jgi:hypothetical protein